MPTSEKFELVPILKLLCVLSWSPSNKKLLTSSNVYTSKKNIYIIYES